MKRETLLFLRENTPKANLLEEAFSKLKDKQWDIRSYISELSIQVGQLFAISCKDISSVMEKERPLDTMEDELCDILLALIYLASTQKLKNKTLQEATQETSTEVEDLVLLSSQITESYMEISGERFRKEHEGKTSEDFFADRIVRMMTICFNIAKKNNIDIQQEFDQMCMKALEFVGNKVAAQEVAVEQTAQKFVMHGINIWKS